MNFCCARSSLRFRLDSARSYSARYCATSASFRVASRPTSNCPLRTTWPSLNPIVAIRPATSGRRITLSLERSEPTARRSSCTDIGLSTTTSTGAGAPVAAPPFASALADAASTLASPFMLATAVPGVRDVSSQAPAAMTTSSASAIQVTRWFFIPKLRVGTARSGQALQFTTGALRAYSRPLDGDIDSTPRFAN